METPLIEMRDVSVVRDGTRILDRISLAIPRMRHTAVLGPNGAGKSSLLKVLMRHFYPSVDSGGQQGTVRILGESAWEVARLRRRMGVVSAQLDLEFSEGRAGRMTVLEAVASGYTATQLKEFGPRLTAAMQREIDRAVELVGMTHLRDRQLATLSTGERRRTLIARAIVHQPDIFVLDEPTVGLDMAAQATFLEILDSLSRHPSITLVLVTHHLEEIPPGIEHVILLDRGKVAFDGAKQEGLTEGRMSELYQTPVRLTRLPSGWYEAGTSSVRTLPSA
ncbi:ATP-binding cassette domain-containing protein [Roseiconus nitratireducens]|uniref:ATP-binding cassette domain-containing protein n=1 Tax=Roseiconus nitratireducens TaxID=2605748 RepID=A0A5M6DJA8_9BACT|nr:ATP-binding cassette domain-containing protein [Roseiconus nitratireducens]KAA5545365.1 ATP-binding cassette domain-containing protein [Roseiconus nitratireducens]